MPGWAAPLSWSLSTQRQEELPAVGLALHPLPFALLSPVHSTFVYSTFSSLSHDIGPLRYGQYRRFQQEAMWGPGTKQCLWVFGDALLHLNREEEAGLFLAAPTFTYIKSWLECCTAIFLCGISTYLHQTLGGFHVPVNHSSLTPTSVLQGHPYTAGMSALCVQKTASFHWAIWLSIHLRWMTAKQVQFLPEPYQE